MDKQGGLQEAREYMLKRDIPQLFESMMTALMYSKPVNHIDFLIECLNKAKVEKDVHWHSFCNPLPPIKSKPKRVRKISPPERTGTFLKDEAPLPPIHQKEEQPWYAEYSNRQLDISVLAGKPVIFVLGGPGSGKGTQCAKLVEKYNFLHLSAGDLLRNEVKKESEIGVKIDNIMKEGQLVPEDVTICLLKEAMIEGSSTAKGFLIDGFPREIGQGKKFERTVRTADMLLYFDCPDDVLVERLLARAKHSQRVDDNEETIKKRLALFHNKTEPVVDYYKQITQKVGANSSIEAIFEETCQDIDYKIFNKLIVSKPVVFVLGGPGSNKEIQCEKLTNKFNLTNISTEALLREEVKSNTEIGSIVEKDIKEGKETSEEITIGLLKDVIFKNNSVTTNGFLIDGFPREFSRATQFETEVCPSSIILFYECDDQVQLSRLNGDEATSKQKLASFHSKTTPLLLRFKDKVQLIDSDRKEDEVFKDSCKALSIIFPEIEEELISEDNVVTHEGSADRKVLFESAAFRDRNIIFVVGGPGSERRQHCERIADRFGYTRVCVGDALRKITLQQGERGSVIKEVLDVRGLVSESIVLDVLGDSLLETGDNETFVIDGFPRELEQAERFEKEISSPNLVIYLSTSENTMKERLQKQLVDGSIIEKRIDDFHSKTLPVVEKYQNIVKEIGISSGNAEEVYWKFVDAVEEFQRSKMTELLEGKDIIFVLGGPGSGKGTQCEKIVEKYGFSHLSTGDLLRDEVQADSARAEELKEIMAKGELVSQETILELLRDAIVKRKESKGFLIDGFPRDVPQGCLFEKSIGHCKMILYFECSNKTMQERLLSRATHSGRVDDNLETIKLRLKTFEDATLPVLQKFSDRVTKVDANRGVDEIFTDVCKVLDSM